jgi:hypothetical protein
MPADGIVCQLCGIEAPARHVELRQNVGALVIRFPRTLKGKICKNCLHKKYWSMTGTTLAVGWLGTISIILAPCFIIANTIYYLKNLGMPGVPPGATVPTLDQPAIDRLNPFAGELINRLNAREDLVVVANDVSSRAQVTPGQVTKYVVALVNQSRQNQAQQKTYASPVVPLPQPPAPQAPATSIPVEPTPAQPIGDVKSPPPPPPLLNL